MIDPRITTDAALTDYYRDHPDISYSDLHEDYAIAYIFGVMFEYNYDEEKANHEEIIKLINAQYESMKDKVLFREHRARLFDSLKTSKAFSTFTELRGYIASNFEYLPMNGRMSIERYGSGIDMRTGWDTHIVKWNNDVIGFTNGNFSK